MAGITWRLPYVSLTNASENFLRELFPPDSSRSGRFPDRLAEHAPKRRSVPLGILTSQPESCAVHIKARTRVKREHEVHPTTMVVSSEGERLVISSEDSSSAQSARAAAEAVHSWHGFRPGCKEVTEVALLNNEFCSMLNRMCCTLGMRVCTSVLGVADVSAIGMKS